MSWGDKDPVIRQPPKGGKDRVIRKPKGGALETATDFMRRVNASIPFGDELIDGAEAISRTIGGEKDAWTKTRARSKEGRDRLKANHPTASAVADTAGPALEMALMAITGGGSKAVTGGAGLLSAAAPKAKVVGEGLLTGLARGGSNVGKAAAVGGADAYAHGVASEGTAVERLKTGSRNVPGGAAAGVIAPLIPKAVIGGANAVKRATTPAAEKSAATAGRILQNRVPDAADVMKVPVGEELPFEQWGQGGRSLARAVGAVDGPGQQAGREAFQARRKGAVPRMLGVTESELGASGDDFYPVKETTRAMRSARADPLYKEARETPIDATSYQNELGPILQTDQGQKALASARRIAMADEAVSEESQGWRQNFIQNNAVVGVEVPDARVLGYLSKGWDDQLRPYRNPITGKLDYESMPEEGKAIERMRREYVKRLGKLVPAEAAARESWADESQMLDALEFGRKSVSGKMDPEQIAARTYEGRPDDRAAQQVGMARGVSDKLKGPNPRAFYRSMETDDIAQERLRAGFGDDPGFERFRDQARTEAGYEQSYADTMQGSRTTPLREDIDAANDAGADPDDMGGMVGMGAEALIRRAGGQSFGSQIGRFVRENLGRREPALRDPVVSELLGEVLFKGRSPADVLQAAAKRELIPRADVLRLMPIFSAAAGEQSARGAAEAEAEDWR